MMSLKLTVFALALGQTSAGLFSNNTKFMRSAFDEFKVEYNRVYSTVAEDAKKFAVFVENMKTADDRNAEEKLGGGSAVHGVTKFSDMSQEEFASRYLKSIKPDEPSKAKVVYTTELSPESSVTQDWTGTYTTSVKNQYYCGSCWAFSATEQIESDAMRTLGDSYTLSPAQITQCDTGSYGCSGGWSESAYDYVTSAGGIETDSDYPYEGAIHYGVTGTCTADSSLNVVTVDEYYTLRTESAMASYVESTGPLSVCLDASTWNSYTGGIMRVCGSSVDHCVQAVGLDSDSYWKVRNSWGTSWGESGYIRLSYGSNTCDITNDPTYVSVSNV